MVLSQGFGGQFTKHLFVVAGKIPQVTKAKLSCGFSDRYRRWVSCFEQLMSGF
jgi:hypothetical protein